MRIIDSARLVTALQRGYTCRKIGRSASSDQRRGTEGPPPNIRATRRTDTRAGALSSASVTSAYKHGERKNSTDAPAATAPGYYYFKSIDRYARNHYDGIRLYSSTRAAFHFTRWVPSDQTTEYQQNVFCSCSRTAKATPRSSPRI